MGNSDGKQVSKLLLIVLSSFLLFTASVSVKAQVADNGPQGEGAQEPGEPLDRPRDLIRELNLTPEQVGRIRAIHEQNKETRQAVQRRLRQAQGALDRAIYFENADENVIEERVRELAMAQAEAMRMRALTELSIRRVLTGEQLNTLRLLRRQARLAERERRQQRLENQPPARDRLDRQSDRLNQGDNSNRPKLEPRLRRGELLRGRRP
jgi:Spy/CpxP family protein refolding chaperone